MASHVLRYFPFGSGRSGDRFPGVARFFAPIQRDPESHPVSCIQCVLGLFIGGKADGAGVDQLLLTSAEIGLDVENTSFDLTRVIDMISTSVYE